MKETITQRLVFHTEFHTRPYRCVVMHYGSTLYDVIKRTDHFQSHNVYEQHEQSQA